MAMDYEVRPEFKDIPLSELLDNSVMCFQGVGDTQNEVLQKYFGVTTIRELANLPFFIWSLGIQELALQQEGNGGTPVSEVTPQSSLKFSVRPEFTKMTAHELLQAPVRALEGLSPVQALALYDGFRITNVTQVVQNRIMLEARIIEYLQKVASGEIAEGSQDGDIASILLSGTDGQSLEAARQALAGQGKGQVGEMAGDIANHLRGRLDDLRSKARDRASELRPTPTAGEKAEEVDRVRPERTRRAGQSRLDTIRETRMRTDPDAIRGARASEQVTASVSSRQELMDRMRGEKTPSVSRTGTRAASSTIIKPSLPVEGDASAAVAGASAAETEKVGTGLGERPTARTETSPAELKKRAAATRPNMVPWIAAAVAALVIIGGVWIWLSSTEPSIHTSSSLETDEAGVGADPAVDETAAETAADSAADETAADSAADQTAAVETESSGPPALPVLSVHEVSGGQSLWRISRGYYNNPELWPWIYRENRDAIQDPDLIYPRQMINIPKIP